MNATLLTINLNSNLLESLEYSGIESLEALNSLNLNDNKLKSLPVDLFEGLGSNLFYLRFHSNEIQTLNNTGINSLFNLRILSMGNNNMTSLAVIKLNNFKYLSHLNITGLCNVSLNEIHNLKQTLKPQPSTKKVFDRVYYKSFFLLHYNCFSLVEECMLMLNFLKYKINYNLYSEHYMDDCIVALRSLNVNYKDISFL